MALDIKPTRSELLKLKKQIKLAKAGHSLLKKKRDGLILEFFDFLKKAKSVRNDLAAAYKEAEIKLNVARVVHSEIELQSTAMAIPKAPDLETSTHNIMGVKVPRIKTEIIQKSTLERGKSVIGASPIVEKAISGYETVVELVIRVAEAETAMKRLLSEIEKTKRRVNALEFNRIPAMEETRKFIQFRLEEMERENVFRLKRIKSK